MTGRDTGSELIGLIAVGVDEQGDRLGALAGGQHHGVLVVEVGGVLDDAHDLVAVAAEIDVIAERGVQIGGDTLRDGDLVDCLRSAAVEH